MPDPKLIDACVHCGFCLPACPTYQSWGEEADSPRGRIVLMKAMHQGQLLPSDDARIHFDRCLGCMGCVTACPSGVKYDALIEQTRAELERALPRRPADRIFRALIFSLFPYPRRWRLALLAALVYQRLGLRWLLRKAGVLRLLPERLRQLEALMPEVRLKSIAAQTPERTAARGEQRARVLLLLGCVQRACFPEVNEATLRVLSAEGCEVIAPRGLGCCGALSQHAGREEESLDFARRAIEEIERANVEAVIVNSAGCGSSMKEWGRAFAKDAAWSARASAAAAKVKDVSEFLAGLAPRAARHPLPLAVAYHDACHLAHAQRIRAQPRALLASIPGLSLREIPDGDQCCGSAGIYNLVQPRSAEEIGGRKLANVLSVGAEILCSANPGCTLHLASLARERGVSLKAAHPIELLDASIRGGRH